MPTNFGRSSHEWSSTDTTAMSSPCAMREARACLRLLGKVRSQLPSAARWDIRWPGNIARNRSKCTATRWIGSSDCAPSHLSSKPQQSSTMSMYSNAATYGGNSTYRPSSHSTSQSHRPQGSGQIYGSSSAHIGRPAPGGFQGYHQGPPPGADLQLWQWFQAVDGDRSGAITVGELQAALVNGEYWWMSFLIHAID